MEAAIYVDCRSLVDNFVKKQSYKLSTFIEQWKEMEFHNIWIFQERNIDLLQTTQAILQAARRIASGKWIGEKTLEAITEQAILRRIGGIYLLYVAYHNQPVLPVRIQVGVETWKTLIKFIEELPAESAKYDNVRYVFWKLVKERAFAFCALDYPVGLENLLEYDKIDNNVHGVDVVKLSEQLPNLEQVQKATVPLSKYEKNYNERKKKLSQKCEKALELLPELTVFAELEKCLKEVNEIITEDLWGEQTEGELSVIDEQPECSNNMKTKLKKKERTHRRMSAKTIFADQLPKIARLELSNSSISRVEDQIMETSTAAMPTLEVEDQDDSSKEVQGTRNRTTKRKKEKSDQAAKETKSKKTNKRKKRNSKASD